MLPHYFFSSDNVLNNSSHSVSSFHSSFFEITVRPSLLCGVLDVANEYAIDLFAFKYSDNNVIALLPPFFVITSVCFITVYTK